MSHYDGDTLLRYRFDTLGRDQALELAEHLRRCAECTARYAELCREVDGLEQYKAEPEDPEGLLQRALSAVHGEPRKATEPQAPARKVTPYPGSLPRVASPGPEPEPEPEPRGTPVLEFLGVKRGARGRIARLAAAAAVLLTTAYVGLGRRTTRPTRSR